MLVHYISVALRNLRRNKFHTAINIIGLSVGLACFVVAYVVVDYIGSFDKGFPNSDRIYAISQDTVISGSEFGRAGLPLTAQPVAKYLRADFPGLKAAYSIAAQEVGIKTASDKSFRQVQFAEPEFLDIFQVPFVAKSSANPLAAPRSAMVRQDVARQMFGDANPIGQTILMGNKVDVTITGIIGDLPSPSHLVQSFAGAPFEMLVSADVFDELNLYGGAADTDDAAQPAVTAETWISIYCFTYVLLPADGSLTIDTFKDRLAGFGDRHMPEGQGRARFSAMHISELSESLVNGLLLQGAMGLTVSGILLFLGGLVLATACLNYANLAIAGALGQGREVGMRKVMGATQGQVLEQYLLEATLLVVAALGVALLMVKAATVAVGSVSAFHIQMPWGAGLSFWLFLVAVVLGVATIAGGYPAFILARVRPIQALRAGTLKGGPRRLRMFLVGVQFATASFLLIAVMVIGGQNSALKKTGLSTSGDQHVVISNNVISAQIDPETFRAALMENKGVKSVTFSQFVPWGFTNNLVTTSMTPDPAAKRESNQRVNISYDYFSTLDIPLLAGRTFSRQRRNDIWPGFASVADYSGPVHAIIDDLTAKQMGWNNPQDAVGNVIYEHMPAGFGSNEARTIETEIIGVVESKPLKLVSMGLKTSIYYLDLTRAGIPIIRVSSADLLDTLDHIDAVWNQMAPNLPMRRNFMDETFDRAYAIFVGLGGILTMLAGFAFLVATMGLFGMATLITRRRTHEIGVRKTMGANTGRILKMLVWSFSKPVVIANLVAWPFAFVVMMGYLSLFTVQVPMSPWPFVASLVITLLIAWAAVGSQAYRAARTNPANVLRYE